MFDTFDNNKLAEPTTLKGYLRDKNPNRKIDVFDYLNKLKGSVLSISNVNSYANEIKNCYLRRCLVKISMILRRILKYKNRCFS